MTIGATSAADRCRVSGGKYAPPSCFSVTIKQISDFLSAACVAPRYSTILRRRRRWFELLTTSACMASRPVRETSLRSFTPVTGIYCLKRESKQQW